MLEIRAPLGTIWLVIVTYAYIILSFLALDAIDIFA